MLYLVIQLNIRRSVLTYSRSWKAPSISFPRRAPSSSFRLDQHFLRLLGQNVLFFCSNLCCRICHSGDGDSDKGATSNCYRYRCMRVNPYAHGRPWVWAVCCNCQCKQTYPFPMLPRHLTSYRTLDTLPISLVTSDMQLLPLEIFASDPLLR